MIAATDLDFQRICHVNRTRKKSDEIEHFVPPISATAGRHKGVWCVTRFPNSCWLVFVLAAACRQSTPCPGKKDASWSTGTTGRWGLHLPRTLKRRPMIMGSSSTWRLLDGMIALPRSTSDLQGTKTYEDSSTTIYQPQLRIVPQQEPKPTYTPIVGPQAWRGCSTEGNCAMAELNNQYPLRSSLGICRSPPTSS